MPIPPQIGRGHYKINTLFLAFLYGDPHIFTFDGTAYTFNGWGEYIIMNMHSRKTGDLLQTVQGRTAPTDTNAGSFSGATVYTAFALRDFQTNASVQIEISRDKQSMA